MKNLKTLILDEYYEPAIGRAIRITLAFILPLVWGLTIGNMTAAIWISMSAQLLSFVSVQGSYPIKLIVIGGTILVSGIVGMLATLIGDNWILATFFMFFIAFFGGFVRQSGHHGPGIAISVLLMYLFCLDHSGDYDAAIQMFTWIVSGGIVALISIVVSWIFTPFGPFRRSVSQTWDSMSDWMRSITLSLSPHASKDHSVDEPDEKELTFREDLSNSIDILSRKQAIAHSRLNRLSLQLVDIRRIISNANPTVASLRDAIDTLKEYPQFPGKLIKYILEGLTQSTHRIALCITTNRRGDIYAAKLSVERLKNNTEVLKKAFPKIISDTSEYQLIKNLEELIDYLEEALKILDDMSSKAVNMSFFMRNFLTGTAIPQRLPIIRFQFHPRSFTFRFSLRLALAMTIGIGIYTYFQIPKGYWIAMTTMIILQPEFGATITKAIRRLKGTISGAIIGALIFLLPLPLPVSLVIVILAAFFMAYYMQQNYALAAFFITIMVIALYQLIVPVTWELGLIRVFNTLGGAGLALLGGFAFFPLWEKYLFPTLLAKAIHANRTYFEALLEIHPLSENETERDFISVRREAEVKNSNAFQSLKRMKEEPGGKRRVNKQDYFVITGYNIRITRLLKTINKQLEQQKVSIYFNTVTDYQELIVDILETTAAMVEKGALYPTKDLPSSDELIRKINDLLHEYPAQENHTEQIARKVLLERLSKEIVGLYYAVKRIIPPAKA